MTRKPLARSVMALLLCVVAMGAYVFLYRSVSEGSERLASLEQEVREKSTDADRIAAAKSTLRTLGEDERSVAVYLVSTTDVVPFLEQLETIGTELGADVSVVSVSTEKVGGRERLLLSLKITGDFEAVMRTVGVIEHSAYDVSVSQLSVGLAGATPGGAWTASGVFLVGTRSTASTTPTKK